MPNDYQKLLVSLEVKRGETLGQLNDLFRNMVQLKEQLEVTEQQIQVGRGVMDGLEQAQLSIKEQIKGEEIADFQEQKSLDMQRKSAEAQTIIEERKKNRTTELIKSESRSSISGMKEFVGGAGKIGDEEHK